jgi:tetratricopeptide (TPR) repeat protein
MMELLVEAERYLSHGLLDHAERLFRQVADADPKSSIAAVGLARVALERSEDAKAYAYARRGLAIDPENPAARHLVLRLEEVVHGRGEALPSEDEIARIIGSNEATTAGLPPGTLPSGVAAGTPVPESAVPPAPATPQPPLPAADVAAHAARAEADPIPCARRADGPARRPGLLGRLFDRRRHR